MSINLLLIATGYLLFRYQLTARIVVIVDTWESLCSDQPWRGRLTREAAMKIIRSESGTRFDPELVRIFCRVIEEK